MKEIKVRVNGSISEPLQQIQDRIRIRAYERFISRGGETNTALDDWLDAERELLVVVTANITREENGIVAEMQLPRIDAKTLLIQVTVQEALVEGIIRGVPEDAEHPSTQIAFGVVRFDQQIDPDGVRAYYGRGLLRLTAPVARSNNLKASA